jgi:hypothetical protein
MKRIVTLFILIMFSLGVFAQTRAKTGLTVGNHTKVGTNIFTMDSITKETATTLYRIYNGSTIQYPYGTILNKDSVNYVLGYMSRFDGVTGLALKVNIADTATMLSPYIKKGDTLSISSIAPLLTDTIPLATFGAGTGLIADTALFNNNVLIGSFYNEGSDTLVITQLMGVMKEGTGTETISVQFSWHATFLSGSATSLNAAALEITSMTTGTADVSFANAKIPPNVFVWGILSGASANNKPTFLSVTLSGYKIPGY